MTWINRILVPIDLSSCATAALRYAVFLGEHTGAVVHVVHVCPETHTGIGGAAADADVPSLAHQRIKKQIHEQLSHIHSDIARQARVHVVAGEPAVAILNLAHEHRVDLIVMGNYGDNTVEVSRTGNVTSMVARHAKCGVVPIHEPTGRGTAFALATTAANAPQLSAVTDAAAADRRGNAAAAKLAAITPSWRGPDHRPSA